MTACTASLAEERLNSTGKIGRLYAMIDAAFLSHVVFWVISAVCVVGAVGMSAAFFSMGRSSHRED